MPTIVVTKKIVWCGRKSKLDNKTEMYYFLNNE